MTLRLLLLMMVACVLVGCPTYHVTNETIPSKPFRAGTVFVGWLSIDETRWQDYGYGSEQEFHKVVVTVNRQVLQAALRDELVDRRVVGAQRPGHGPPREAAIAVVFEDTTLYDVTGHSALTISTDVKLMDLKHDKVLYATRVTANTRGIGSWAAYNLEACIEQAATNLAGFVTSRFE
jgi:hypothetical protein